MVICWPSNNCQGMVSWIANAAYIGPSTNRSTTINLKTIVNFQHIHQSFNKTFGRIGSSWCKVKMALGFLDVSGGVNILPRKRIQETNFKTAFTRNCISDNFLPNILGSTIFTLVMCDKLELKLLRPSCVGSNVRDDRYLYSSLMTILLTSDGRWKASLTFATTSLSLPCWSLAAEMFQPGVT